MHCQLRKKLSLKKMTDRVMILIPIARLLQKISQRISGGRVEIGVSAFKVDLRLRMCHE